MNRKRNWDVTRSEKQWDQLAAKKTKDNSDMLGEEEGYELRFDIKIAEFKDVGSGLEENKDTTPAPPYPSSRCELSWGIGSETVNR